MEWHPELWTVVDWEGDVVRCMGCFLYSTSVAVITPKYAQTMCRQCATADGLLVADVGNKGTDGWFIYTRPRPYPNWAWRN